MSNLKEIENLETAIERYEKKETTKKITRTRNRKNK